MTWRDFTLDHEEEEPAAVEPLRSFPRTRRQWFYGMRLVIEARGDDATVILDNAQHFRCRAGTPVDRLVDVAAAMDRGDREAGLASTQSAALNAFEHLAATFGPHD